MVQLSHPDMTTWKTIALTIQTFVGKVMSLIFNTMSRFVIAFLPRGKHLLILWLWSLSSVTLESKKVNLSLFISASWDVVIHPCLKDFGSQDSHLCCFPLLLLLYILTSSCSPVPLLVGLTVNCNIPQLQRAHSNFSEKSHWNPSFLPCGDGGSTLKPPSLLCLSGTPPYTVHSSFPSSASGQFLCSQPGQGLSLVLLQPSFLKNLNGSLFPTSF